MAFFSRRGDPSSLIPFMLAFMALNLTNTMATAPFSALILDIVPVSQRGAASGRLGLRSGQGNFVGRLVCILLGVIGGTVGAYWLIMISMLLGMAGMVPTRR